MVRSVSISLLNLSRLVHIVLFVASVLTCSEHALAHSGDLHHESAKCSICAADTIPKSSPPLPPSTTPNSRVTDEATSIVPVPRSLVTLNILASVRVRGPPR